MKKKEWKRELKRLQHEILTLYQTDVELTNREVEILAFMSRLVGLVKEVR